MKLLVYGINFAPELTGIGKYTGEMVAWLAAQGHEVRVVTAPPYYPDWAVWPAYSASRYAREDWHGATVIRTPLWVPRKVTGLRRLLHLGSFALTSIPARLVSLPNWAHVSGIQPLSADSPYRAELGIRSDAVVALYSGNMGAKQGLELLAETASVLAGRPDIEFVFCGNGAGRAELMRRC